MRARVGSMTKVYEGAEGLNEMIVSLEVDGVINGLVVAAGCDERLHILQVSDGKPQPSVSMGSVVGASARNRSRGADGMFTPSRSVRAAARTAGGTERSPSGNRTTRSSNPSARYIWTVGVAFSPMAKRIGSPPAAQ